MLDYDNLYLIHVCRCDMGLHDLLKFAGISSPEVCESVLESSRMSVASFDVESFCVPLDGVTGQEHLAGPHPDTLSDVRISRQVVGRQQACLVG